MAGAEAGIGRLLTDVERAAWPRGELRSAFVVAGSYFLTAWHCLEPLGGQSAKPWLRLQPRGPAELYLDVPVRYQAHQSALDAAVLVVDFDRLSEVGEAQVVDEVLAFLHHVALPLDTTVNAHDVVRVGGFPERNPARHPTLFSGHVNSPDALIGHAPAIRVYVPEFAARYAEWPDGMSGGPLLREFEGVEHAVGVVSSYPKSSPEQGATGGTVLCRRVKELSVAFPMLDSAVLPVKAADAGWLGQGRVYISVGARGLTPYRDAAAEVCQRHGLRPLRSNELSLSPAGRQREIASCNIFLLLLDDRATAEEEFLSELEYDWATNAARLPKMLVFVRRQAQTAADQTTLGGLASRIGSRHLAASLSELGAFRLHLYQLIDTHKPRDTPMPWTWSRTHDHCEPDDRRTLPSPPAMYAVPDYVGGTPFTGRIHELEHLEDWAESRDPVMVVEAIGGTGKSALAWEWTKNHRDRFDGTFWWSFYDGFSSMERFLRELLAYLRSELVTKINDLERQDLPGLVLHELRRRPFLVVLDGFERLLLAYHQYDPSKVTDHDVDADRRANKHSMIDGLGYDFVRRLAASWPAKVLITTRMVPDALEGPGGGLVPGTRKYRLPGLTDHDTHLLLMELGVTGSPQRESAFFGPLGNHPLLIAIVAGMVRDHRVAPGRFDEWLSAQSFDILKVNLATRRRHILATALDGLDSDASKLLGWISALAGSVHWRVLESINPYAESNPDSAGALLDAALRDLEVRGLVWWNRASNTYDMHPVVRAFAHEQMDNREKVGANERIRDYFQALPPEEPASVNSVEDLQQTITLFRALTGALQHASAAFVWFRRLADPLMVDLGANATVIELLQPYSEPRTIPLSADLSIALHLSGKHNVGISVELAILQEAVLLRDAKEIRTSLGRLATHYRSSGRLASYAEVLDVLAVGLQPTDSMWVSLSLHRAILDVICGVASSFHAPGTIGSDTSTGLSTMNNPWISSDATYWELVQRSQLGLLEVGEIEDAERIHPNWRNRLRLAIIKFDLLLHLEQYSRARCVADEIDRLRRTGGREMVPAENAVALGLLGNRSEATAAVSECMAALPRLHPFDQPYRLLAVALKILGRRDEAVQMAQLARRSAWADGPKLSYYADLRKAEALLTELGVQQTPFPEARRAKAELPNQSRILRLLRRGQ
jgi:hypothetical protein